MTYKKLLTWMKESLIDYWRYWIVAGLGLLVALVVLWRLNPWDTEPRQRQENPVPRLSSSLSEKHEKVATDKGEKRPIGASGQVVVDLKGAVNHQGVVNLPPGSRLQDAIQQAGGLTDQADRNRINLAQLLVDGQAIYIEKVGEEGPSQLTESGELSGGGNISTGRTTKGHAFGQGGSRTRVNLNTASAKELETLDGIGPKKAEQIVAFRVEKHRFQSVDDLKEVGGIGPKRFEQLKEQVTV